MSILCISISSRLIANPPTHDVLITLIVDPTTNHVATVPAFAPPPSPPVIPIAVTPVSVSISIIVAISTFPTLRRGWRCG